MPVPPTTHLTTHPTALPDKKSKVTDVLILSKMKLPSFEKEYTNTMRLLETRLEEYKIFTKFEVAIFLRTRD